jgi:hypothetical protein
MPESYKRGLDAPIAGRVAGSVDPNLAVVV